MESYLILALFVLIGGLFGTGLYLSGRRQKDLQAWCEPKGLRFEPSFDKSVKERFPDFPCLAEGFEQYAFNWMAGDWEGREFLGFDYHYETDFFDRKRRRQVHHHHFSAVILAAAFPLEPLLIVPADAAESETVPSELAQVRFDSPEFDETFLVYSSDAEQARKALGTAARELLLSTKPFAVQFDRSHVLVWRRSIFKVEDFDAAAHLAKRLPEDCRASAEA